MPDWFRVSARANYGQVIEDSDGAGQLQQPVHHQQPAGRVLRLDHAALRHDFGRVTAEASYSVGFVDYKGGNQGEFGAFNDSDEYRIDAGIFQLGPGTALRLGAALQQQRDRVRGRWTCRRACRRRFRRPSSSGSRRSSTTAPGPTFRSGSRAPAARRRVRLRERPDRQYRRRRSVQRRRDRHRDGGLDETFWSAGLRWEPDERTSVEARTGDRFFGTSYFLRGAAPGPPARVPCAVSRGADHEQPAPGVRRTAARRGHRLADQRPVRVDGVPRHADLDGRRTRVALDVFGSIATTSTSSATRTHRRATQRHPRLLGDDAAGCDLTTENVDRASRSIEREDSDHRLNRFTAELTRELGSRSELTAVAGLNQKTDAGPQNYDGAWIGLRYRYEF